MSWNLKTAAYRTAVLWNRVSRAPQKSVSDGDAFLPMYWAEGEGIHHESLIWNVYATMHRQWRKLSGRMPIRAGPFCDDAIEVDVDARSDGKKSFIGGIMEHVEQEGVQFGEFSLFVAANSVFGRRKDELAAADRGNGHGA